MLTRAFVSHYWTNGLAGIPLPRTEITGRKSGLWKSGPLGARSVTGPERLFFCSFAARTQSPIYHGLRHWLILVPLCGFLWIRCSPFLPESKVVPLGPHMSNLATRRLSAALPQRERVTA